MLYRRREPAAAAASVRPPYPPVLLAVIRSIDFSSASQQSNGYVGRSERPARQSRCCPLRQRFRPKFASAPPALKPPLFTTDAYARRLYLMRRVEGNSGRRCLPSPLDVCSLERCLQALALARSLARSRANAQGSHAAVGLRELRCVPASVLCVPPHTRRAPHPTSCGFRQPALCPPRPRSLVPSPLTRSGCVREVRRPSCREGRELQSGHPESHGCPLTPSSLPRASP